MNPVNFVIGLLFAAVLAPLFIFVLLNNVLSGILVGAIKGAVIGWKETFQ